MKIEVKTSEGEITITCPDEHVKVHTVKSILIHALKTIDNMGHDVDTVASLTGKD